MKAEQIKSSASTGLVPASKRVPDWVMPIVKSLIVFADALLAFGCFAAAYYLREGHGLFREGSWAWSDQFAPYAAVLVFVIPIRILSLLYQRVYRMSGAFTYPGEFIKVTKAVLIGSLFIIAATFLFRGGFEYRTFSYSRGVFALDFILALPAFTFLHLSVRYVQSLFRRRGINLIPTLIVGLNLEAQQTVKELREQPDLGLRVVGIISADASGDKIKGDGGNAKVPRWITEYGTSLVGSLEELPEIIGKLNIQEVIITESDIPGEILFETMMKSGSKENVEFRLAPSLFNFMPQKTTVEQIGILPMVRLFREPLSDLERFIKRVSDIGISLLAILIFAPVWLLFSILIKMDSTGAILFSQERVGMDGRKFMFYKFRTMVSGSDEAIHRDAYKKNIEGISEANAGETDKPVFGKVKNDPRVTRVGKFMRRSSLDELPQLINVLKGDMSIVGPRPPIPYEVEEYDIWHRKRLDMKPGMTGLWQVSGRNRLPFEEMVKIDLFYIENWSLWLDLRILLLTIPAVFRGDGAK